MNRRNREIAHNLFYNEYDMMGKFDYIKKVMASCTSQIECSTINEWGNKVLWSYYNLFHDRYGKKYGFCEWLDIEKYFFHRTRDITRELTNYKMKLWSES